MKIMVVGDTHGYNNALLPKLDIAGKLRIQHVIVVGDFGLWDHLAEGHEFLDAAQSYADANQLSVYAVGGNHENWDHWNWYIKHMPTHKGFAMVRRRVLLIPKVHSWTWAKQTFVVAGGAVSVDREERLERETGRTKMGAPAYNPFNGRPYRATGLRTQWWPDEQLTDADVATVDKMNVKADYLFTHDCSDFTNFHTRLKPDIDSQHHRQRIDKVIAAVKPDFHFHGHMHTKYEWKNTRSHGLRESSFGNDETDWNGHATATYGLECNSDKWSWGVLDTDNRQFTWGPHVLSS